MIDTQAIRIKILDLAIRGQLTEQLAEDGMADDLYGIIRNEQESLIKAGKIKKNKALPDINPEEIPFEIPPNWKWVRLADICSIINGDRGKNYPAKSTLKHEGIPFISAINLNGESVTKDENLLCLDDNQYNLLRSGKLQRGDVVICIRGSLGKHGRYPYEKGAIASSLVISRLYYESIILGNYEMAWLDSSAFREEIDKYNNGTAQPNLAANNLEKFLFPLPPLKEQARIVDKIKQTFSELSIIDELQRQYADNIFTLKSKLIDAAICGKLTEQLQEDGTAEELVKRVQEGGEKEKNNYSIITAEEIPFDIPKNWKWCRLSDISTTNIGLTYHPEEMVTKDGTVVIRSSNIVNSKMDYSDLVRVKCQVRSNQFLNNHDIVICARNGSKALVGKCAIYEGESGVVSFGAFMAVLRTPLYQYVFYYLLTDTFRRYFHSDDSKQINQVTQDILKKALIPIPPLAEQRRIVAKLDELLKLIEMEKANG